MNSLIATVNLDIGRGISNPTLQIYPTTDVPSLVYSFVHQQALPSYTQTLILHEIATQLSKHHIQLKSVDCDEKDQESTIEGEEIQNLQDYGSEWKQQISPLQTEKSALPYSPIQMLKSEMGRECRQGGLAMQNVQKVRKNVVVENGRKKRREERMTFGELRERRIGRVYMKLKGRGEGEYLSVENINFRQFNLQMLKWLQQLFLTLDEDDFHQLDEEKFVQLVKQRGLQDGLMERWNKGRGLE